MSKHQRDKGGRGERELAKFLTDLGYPTERSARNGVTGAEDIDCPSLRSKGFVVECKRVEGLKLGTGTFKKLFAKARSQHPGLIPLLFWRYDRSEWNMTTEYECGGLWTATERASIAEALKVMIEAKEGA